MSQNGAAHWPYFDDAWLADKLNGAGVSYDLRAMENPATMPRFGQIFWINQLNNSKERSHASWQCWTCKIKPSERDKIGITEAHVRYTGRKDLTVLTS